MAQLLESGTSGHSQHNRHITIRSELLKFKMEEES